ncbi:Chloramphenicol acetyltransferase-like domain containing protein [Trema orientale]|uniref:Chloramphenicol acetyltransferase-like domain containing protein n=1 Tax=Trema orientale TaxID=63057 RepID=A0A2P5FKV0_TREOI|nr:Chloramphenicol acetyltransferase-like domain containing protein [Trema orientale]
MWLLILPPNSLYTLFDTLWFKFPPVEPESTADFSLPVSRIIHSASTSRPLVPQLSVTDIGASVIVVQITLFPNDDGFCVGITTHHVVLDEYLCAYLCKEINDWKSTGTPMLLQAELTPFYDRTVISEPNGLDMSFPYN